MKTYITLPMAVLSLSVIGFTAAAVDKPAAPEAAPAAADSKASGAGSGSAAGAGSGSAAERPMTMAPKAEGGCGCCKKMGGGSGSNTPMQMGGMNASSAAFAAVNEQMHAAMAQAYTGDADKDFVAGMIPHHRGAVDMAKLVLAFGKDPEIRKLAEDIIKAQDAEMALMEAWMKKSAKP